MKNALTLPTILYIRTLILKNAEVGVGNWLYILKKNNIQSLPNPSSFVNVNIKKQYKLTKCLDIHRKLDLITVL